MDAGEHNPSRRALLGVAVALPLVRHSGHDPESTLFSLRSAGSGIPDQVRNDGYGNGEEWRRALAAFEEARAAVRGIEAASAGCGFEEEEELLPAHDAACAAAERALGRLLLAPVPDLAGLAAKLELFLDHALEPHSAAENVLAAIRSDARRLAGAVTGA